MNPAPPVTSTFMDIVWTRGYEASREARASRPGKLHWRRRGRQVGASARPGASPPMTPALLRVGAVAALSFLAALALTPAVIRLAAGSGLLDRPNARSLHARVTPRGG